MTDERHGGGLVGALSLASSGLKTISTLRRRRLWAKAQIRNWMDFVCVTVFVICPVITSAIAVAAEARQPCLSVTDPAFHSMLPPNTTGT
ncbi:hypothetical protein PTE30175_04981 [Pandoraea terrae]|uniref:Uncharacterized protein n=1 Tax=Pandoraea terrae TaxID=1537710 RepID=A0A5E4Z6C6_9BURK|nr:hypothetical protein PTE30175_04981 [Pandoraea terrae]